MIYKTVLPAMALFGAAALGLLALGHQLVGQTSANAVVTAPASEANGSNYVSASQLRTASLRKEGDGHYWASARVNGVPVKFLPVPIQQNLRRNRNHAKVFHQVCMPH